MIPFFPFIFSLLLNLSGAGLQGQRADTKGSRCRVGKTPWINKRKIIKIKSRLGILGLKIFKMTEGGERKRCSERRLTRMKEVWIIHTETCYHMTQLKT